MIIYLESHRVSKKSHVQSIKHDGIFINWFRCKVSANETHEGIQLYWWIPYVSLLIWLSDRNRFQLIIFWIAKRYTSKAFIFRYDIFFLLSGQYTSFGECGNICRENTASCPSLLQFCTICRQNYGGECFNIEGQTFICSCKNGEEY